MRLRLRNPLISVFFFLSGSLTPAHGADPMDRILSDVAQYVRVVQREFSMYHYAKRGSLGVPVPGAGILDPQDPNIRDHVANWANYFFENEKTGTAKGLYLSPDPLTSRAFGGQGDAWALWKVRIPLDTLVLDLITNDGSESEESERYSMRIPSETRSAIREAGCEQVPFWSWQRFFMDASTVPCKKLSQEILKKTGIHALTYTYGRVDFPEVCSKTSSFAMILLNPKGVQSEFFYKEMKPSPEQPLFNTLFLLATGSTGASPLWPELDRTAQIDQVTDYLKRNVIECDGPRSDYLREPTVRER